MMYGSFSRKTTQAHTISYIVRDSGIPMELRVNYEIGYSTITVKLEEELAGYSLFAQDPSENMIQNKKREGTNLDLIREDLERLVELD